MGNCIRASNGVYDTVTHESHVEEEESHEPQESAKLADSNEVSFLERGMFFLEQIEK